MVVTGGSGFIGSHLVERALRAGHHVLVLDDYSTGSPELLDEVRAAVDGTLDVIECDIATTAGAQAIVDFAPQVIVHLAAQTDVVTSVSDPVEDARRNVLGTVNVLAAARQVGTERVVLAETAAVYGDVDESVLPITEDLAHHPLSPYGISKSVGLEYGRWFASTGGPRVVAALLANVYGPRQGSRGEGGVVSVIGHAATANTRFTVFGDGNQTRDFVFVGDVADRILWLATADHRVELAHVSTGVESSVNDLIAAAQAALATPLDVVYADARVGEIARSALSPQRLIDAGAVTESVQLQDGIKQTLAWYGAKLA
jgi:UDP-glucose 4-epimerase